MFYYLESSVSLYKLSSSVFVNELLLSLLFDLNEKQSLLQINRHLFRNLKKIKSTIYNFFLETVEQKHVWFLLISLLTIHILIFNIRKEKLYFCSESLQLWPWFVCHGPNFSPYCWRRHILSANKLLCIKRVPAIVFLIYQDFYSTQQHRIYLSLAVCFN